MTSGTLAPPCEARIMDSSAETLTRQDFVSGQTVRWCPGCGDYAILAQIQNTLPTLGIPREKIVVISGIGCSSRFPYYMNTYGFHTIHGRAAAIATGVQLAREDLHVWVITGDGDALSIGGNHFIHTIRRNVNLRFILFNNAIYGLTKGQYSPTSPKGTKTKSTPRGSIENPLHPISLALGTEATFVARTLAADPKHLATVLQKAARHKGTAFVEVLQNCLIFNDGCFDFLEDKTRRAETALYCEDGKPLLFGGTERKGIGLNGFSQKVVAGNDPGVLVHDETNEDPGYAWFLSRLRHPEFPVPLGVFRSISRPVFDEQVRSDVARARAENKLTWDEYLLRRGTWKV